MSAHDRTMLLPTWFPTRLRGLRPGGLPQDFLIHGAPNLLLYDYILCDPDSLACELEFKKRFLSSAIYGTLRDCRILQPLSAQGIPRFLSPEVMSPARANETVTITTLMQEQLRELDSRLTAGSRRAQSPQQLIRISSQISLFDTEMLIEFSSTLKGVIPYIQGRGKDNIWPSSRIPSGFAAGSRSRPQTERLLNRLTGRPITLLPEIRDDAARAALKENMRLERPALLRWLLGDHSLVIDNFHDWRLSDKRVRSADMVIDSGRVDEAQSNLEIILRARDRTSDVRREVQQRIDSLLEAENPVKALDRLLDEEIREIADEVAAARDAVLHSRSSVRERVVTALEFAPTLLLAALGMAGVPNAVTAPADIGTATTLLALERAYAKKRAAKERESYPLTSFRASMANASRAASRSGRETKSVKAIRKSFPVT
jgi:hypothetical protein